MQFVPYRRTDSQLNISQAREGVSSSYGKHAEIRTLGPQQPIRKKHGLHRSPKRVLEPIINVMSSREPDILDLS